MTFVEVVLLGFALVVDAIAVAAAAGVASPRVRLADAARMGLVFGAFHVAMPALGYSLGAGVGALVQAWDHWIAAGLLGLVAVGMLRGALRGEEARASDGAGTSAAGRPAAGERVSATFGLRGLLPLALATSVDALAVGISLPMMGAPLASSLVTFGVLAFIVSAGTALLARRAGRLLGLAAQRGLTLVGALVLLGVAVRIVIEHTERGI